MTTPGSPLQWDPYRQEYRPITPAYARRLQRGYAQGLSRSQSRRGSTFRIPDAVIRAYPQLVISERSLTRLRRQLRQQGVSEAEFESVYGFSLAYWYYIWVNWADDINRLATDGGGQITPSVIQGQLVNANYTGHGPDWIEFALGERLYAMRQYRAGNNIPGYNLYRMEGSSAPVEFWWYH